MVANKILGISMDMLSPSTTSLRADGLVQMDNVCASVYHTLSAREALLVLAQIAKEAMTQIKFIIDNKEHLRWI